MRGRKQIVLRSLRFAVALFALSFAWSAGGGAQSRSATAPVIPLCPSLTIVTAVRQQQGDYESIKTILSVTDSDARMKYSVERLVQDMFSSDPPKLQKYTLYRTVRRSDLDSAILYEQQFSSELPEMVPETTAIGTSAAVLNALKTKGESKLGIFIAYSQIKPSLDRNTHPNVYDNQMIANITRVGDKPVMLPVIVNDVRVELPTIQARGDFFGDKSEFFFLDDPANPLTLKFRVGIDALKPIDANMAKVMGIGPRPAGDKDVLQVTKITIDAANHHLRVPAEPAANHHRPEPAGALALAAAVLSGRSASRDVLMSTASIFPLTATSFVKNQNRRSRK